MRLKVSTLHRLLLIALPVVLGGAVVGLIHSLGAAAQRSASQVGTAFTYQGYLTDGGGPADGPFDFIFTLHDDPAGGAQVGQTIPVGDLDVGEGHFSVELDFEQGGGPVLDGTALWLGIQVRPGAETGSYTTLSPRQPLSPAPYAVYASRSDWAGLQGVPDGLDDGDDDTTYTAGAGLVLTGTTLAVSDTFQVPQGCIEGENPQWSGGGWVCDPDDDTLAQLGCDTGEIPKWNGSAWFCGQDDTGGGGGGDGDITAVYSGFGLEGGSDFGDVTLSVTTDTVQSRVGDACPAGMNIRQINQDGTVVCDPDDDTTYTAGAGLVLSDTTLAISVTYRLPQTCASGQLAQWDGAGWHCDPDDDTTYSAGPGLVLTDTTLAIGSTHRLPQTCSAGQLPQWDGGSWSCDPDDDTLAELSCGPGQIVKWTGTAWECAQDNIGSDGVGDITGVYSGDGLTGGGPSGEITLTVAFGGVGTASTVARSDHDHNLAYYTQSQLATSGGGDLVHWDNLGGVPAGLNDGDDDLLSSLSCADGEILEGSGGGWVCGTDDVGSGGGSGDITAVYSGFGLSGGAPSGDITLAVVTGTIQSRVGDTCPAGASIREINQDGTVVCEPDDDTTYSAGVGLEISGGTFAISPTFQLPQGCDDGLLPKWDSTGGVWECAADIDSNSIYTAGAGLVLTGTTFAISETYQLPQTCNSGQIINWNGAGWSCQDAGPGGTGWSLTGNAGTTAGTNFLGTTDDEPLELWVNNLRALLLEPGGASPNLVGGYGGNSVDASTVGAAVGGGGRDLALNEATGDYSVVDGGAGNTAGGYASAVGGGEGNTTGGSYSAVGGGAANVVSGNYATVGGGQNNSAGASHAIIGGGHGNVVSGTYGAVGGGHSNLITATLGAIGGGANNAIYAEFAAVGGGRYNDVSAAYGTIAGGGPADLGNPTTSHNQVIDDYGTIGGGGGNQAGSEESPANYATVGGGQANTAGASHATVSGGMENQAVGDGASIGGGWSNVVTATYATVGGGYNNEATAKAATIGGGQSNTVGANYATIGGGFGNEVAAGSGTIPGGAYNYVGGSFGFAAGYQAQAEHQGSFVWSDYSSGAFASTAPDQFLIQAAGGVGIGTNRTTPTHTLSVGGNAAVVGEGRLVPRGVFTGSSAFSGLGIQKPSAVDAAGDTIYVTSWATNTLFVIDVSDPDHPNPITFTTSSLVGPLDVQVAGGLAFIACESNDRLVIIDVSDPGQKFRAIGASDPRHMGLPQAVYVSGNHAYVAAYGDGGTGDRAGLFIFDVSDPATVLLVGFTDVNLDRPTDVFVAGDHAYVTSWNNDSLAIFDVSDPENILAKGAFSDTTTLDGPTAVRVRGGYAYVLAENSGRLAVLDISDPFQVSLVDSMATTLTRPRSLFLSGDYVYVAYVGDDGTYVHSGLAVFDVSDAAGIQLLSEVDMSGSLPGPEGPVAIDGSGGHIYVANENHDSVMVYDINQLTAPAITAGTIQADRLESLGDAEIEHNLSVGDGLNVGPGGTLIEGQLAVAGENYNYILGNLSLGAAGFIDEAEDYQELYPTHQLDVHGYSRYRISDEHSLIMAGSREQGAFFDFTSNDFGAFYSPTARILFEVPDPFTHTTEIEILTQSATDTRARGRAIFGEEITFYHVAPDLTTRTTITFTKNGDVLPGVDNTYKLGDADHRWQEVYAANGTIQTSDARWKEDVSDLGYGLDEIERLRPVSFSWVDNPAGGQHYGLIAQEVAGILPEVIRGGEDGRPLGMNYSELVPVLVKAVQEQQEQLEGQSQEIAALEARLSALEQGGAQAAGPGWLKEPPIFGAGGLALLAGILLRRRRPGGTS